MPLVIDHTTRLMASGEEIMTGAPSEVGQDARVRELDFGKEKRGLDQSR
jgi:ABC-type branched-subunit amino acid transport system ATPase component